MVGMSPLEEDEVIRRWMAGYRSDKPREEETVSK